MGGAQWRGPAVEAGEDVRNSVDIGKNVRRRLHAPLGEFVHAARIGNAGELRAEIIVRRGGHEHDLAA